VNHHGTTTGTAEVFVLFKSRVEVSKKMKRSRKKLGKPIQTRSNQTEILWEGANEEKGTIHSSQCWPPTRYLKRSRRVG